MRKTFFSIWILGCLFVGVSQESFNNNEEIHMCDALYWPFLEQCRNQGLEGEAARVCARQKVADCKRNLL